MRVISECFPVYRYHIMFGLLNKNIIDKRVKYSIAVNQVYLTV